MSIYRRPGWTNREDIHQFSARDPDAPSEDGPVYGAAAPPKDWSKYRKAQPAEYLLPASEHWMDTLPPDVFPGALATQFPRIVNLIAMQWDHANACHAYFDELLVDRRGGRQGFPAAVKRDLMRLREYWYGFDPTLK